MIRPFPYHLRGLLAAVLVLASGPGSASGQLISPGKLSSVHAGLDGMTRCTRCHDLGERGISAQKCLDCHRPIASRLGAGRGLHGRADSRDCGTCHSEHLGVGERIVRFDTTRFDHSEAGFDLQSAHRAVSCRSCHRPSLVADPEVLRAKAPAGAVARTFLGLDPRCEGCHEADDPHAGQFPDPDCSACHDEAGWKGAPRFDHATTRYPLTGRHRSVACASCHPRRAGGPVPGAMRFAGIEHATCSSCHRDPHAGRMGSGCAGCHSTEGWSELAGGTFSTASEHSRTGFDLVGAHALAPCSACHARGGTSSRTVRLQFGKDAGRRRYPAPAHDSCRDCHLDIHEGGLPRRGDSSPCTDCHSRGAWSPSSFGALRHGAETRFALTGAHLAVACSACHAAAADDLHLEFGHEDRDCAGCHGKDDPHGGQFSTTPDRSSCSSCHGTDTWRAVSIDHAATGFPLTGRHVSVACAACHVPSLQDPVIYRGLVASCAACHARQDPHRDQFRDRSCTTCHDAESFHLSGFDHTRTQFPLDSAHRDVACARCHRLETDPADGRTFVRFRPLDTQCSSCHAS